MPELPEVETIRRGLAQLVIGYAVTGVEVRFARIFTGDTTHITNATILAVRRFGKGLVIDFDSDYSLAIHVKMTGQLIFRGKDITKSFHPRLALTSDLPNKWTHVVFTLKMQSEKLKVVKEAVLYYNDIRKFGWIKVVETRKVHDLPFFKNLGPEPLSNLPAGRQGVTIQRFSNILNASQAPIKSLLMNQQKIAGIGNIYANDALFLAKIDPSRKASSLSTKESIVLLSAVESVLQKAIDAGGASDVNYVNAEGGRGEYQNHFLVYKQTGKPCKNCGMLIQRIKFAGRGTFFCSKCQK